MSTIALLALCFNLCSAQSGWEAFKCDAEKQYMVWQHDYPDGGRGQFLDARLIKSCKEMKTMSAREQKIVARWLALYHVYNEVPPNAVQERILNYVNSNGGLLLLRGLNLAEDSLCGRSSAR